MTYASMIPGSGPPLTTTGAGVCFSDDVQRTPRSTTIPRVPTDYVAVARQGLHSSLGKGMQSAMVIHHQSWDIETKVPVRSSYKNSRGLAHNPKGGSAPVSRGKVKIAANSAAHVLSMLYAPEGAETLILDCGVSTVHSRSQA
eukprot:scaffold7979_cov417-Prasinococcus_capsulatus_cf.AAC.7